MVYKLNLKINAEKRLRNAITQKRFFSIQTIFPFLCCFIMATVIITGGTGMIGKALTKELVRRNYDVIILTRDKSRTKDLEKVSYAGWDIEKGLIDRNALIQSDYIVHLAGANVAEKRWTAKRKKEIVDSRVKSGELIVKVLAETPNKVKAVLSSSAIGWYGPDSKIPSRKPFMEADPAHRDFLGSTCKQWEEAIEPVTNLDKRLVVFRTGIVLSNEGGAFVEFKKPLRFKVATVMGSGKQVVSWIHIDDLVRLYINAIEDESWKGVYNAVALHPVSNGKLVKAIANHSGKKYFTFHVPEIALKVALGEMSIEVLKSATVSNKKVELMGFQFSFPEIDGAVKNLISREQEA